MAYWNDELTPTFTVENGPLMPESFKVSVAEAEIVLDGFLDPDRVMTSNVFVKRLIPARERVKEIEQRTVRQTAEV